MPRHDRREAQPFNGLHILAGLFSDLAVKFVLSHVIAFRSVELVLQRKELVLLRRLEIM